MNSGAASNEKQIVNLEPGSWVDRHGDYLYNYAYSRVLSKELSEDLVQETFIAALKAMSSFRGKSSELTWLIAILKRKIIDHFRKSSTKREVATSRIPDQFHDHGVMKGHWKMDKGPKLWPGDLDDPIHQEEFRSVLESCLSLLPDKWKAVFIMKFIEEAESDEVCKELGCTPSNFWVILHRTRLKLRECIEIKWLR